MAVDGTGVRTPQEQRAGGRNRHPQAQDRGLPDSHPRANVGAADPLAARIFAAGRELLEREIDGTKFRLIGIGLSSLIDADKADLADLLDHRSAEAERAVDRLRAKFGDEAVFRGLTLEDDDEDERRRE